MATEKRLIDANALKAIFDKRYDDAFMQERTRTNASWWDGYAIGVNWGRNTITDIPTVDAVEVVHGEWTIIEDDYCGLTGLECSHCKKTWWFDEESPIREYHYCPGCGADMRGDGNG